MNWTIVYIDIPLFYEYINKQINQEVNQSVNKGRIEESNERNNK